MPSQFPKIKAAEREGHTGDAPIEAVRYRAGRKPKHLLSDRTEDDEGTLEIREKKQQVATDMVHVRPSRRRIVEAEVEEEDVEPARPLLPPRGAPAAAGSEQQEEPMQEDEEVMNERRRKAREKYLQGTQEEEAMQRIEDEDMAESSSESEYETDDDDDLEDDHEPMLKPVFVTKKERVTMDEKEKLEKEEHEIHLREAKKKEKRAQQSKTMVVEAVQRDKDKQQRAGVDSDDEDIPDDDDDINEAEEYAAWKVREIKRVKWYQEQREKWEAEKTEIERRRQMTDEERRKEDENFEKEREKMLREQGIDPSKAEWQFLQKYYHKGSYYNHTDEHGVHVNKLMNKDYGHATGEDKFNKKLMPQVMQVKNFGKMGQVKWTHLTNEDTTVKATDNIFTTGTTLGASKTTDRRNAAAAQSYNATHFTYAHEKATTLGSSRYGGAGMDQSTLLDRPSKKAKY